MNKFEQLIEYVINDEEAKARELFHELVVEKSRAIYEEMMAEEEFELDEAADEELDEAEHDEELDESEDDIDESLDEMGGDAADDLIDDIEVEEEGVSMEGDDEGMDDDNGEELEDRVVDLEDKLDELMSEFESLMSDDAGMDAEDDMDADTDMDMDMDMDSVGMDSEEVVDDELETEGMYENIDLKAAPKPVTSEEGSVNKKSTVAANAGARGAMAKPVHATGTEAQGRLAPGTKELVGKVGNTPAQSTQKPTPATKPTLSQAAGVNTKSVVK